MRFAQFYRMSTGYGNDGIPEPVEACGSNSVFVLDGRWSSTTCNEVARQTCIDRGYIGYALHQGVNFYAPAFQKFKGV